MKKIAGYHSRIDRFLALNFLPPNRAIKTVPKFKNRAQEALRPFIVVFVRNPSFRNAGLKYANMEIRRSVWQVVEE